MNKGMSKAKWMLGALTAALFAGGLLTSVSGTAQTAAQLNPEPLDCACSKGIDLGSPKSPMLLKNCTCGQLQCAVLPASGQLQCR